MANARVDRSRAMSSEVYHNGRGRSASYRVEDRQQKDESRRAQGKAYGNGGAVARRRWNERWRPELRITFGDRGDREAAGLGQAEYGSKTVYAFVRALLVGDVDHFSAMLGEESHGYRIRVDILMREESY